MAGHENSGAALVSWTLTTQAVDLTVLVDLTTRKRSALAIFKVIFNTAGTFYVPYLVVLEHSELDLLSLVLVLLGGGVRLLLPLLSTTTQPQHQVQGGLLEQTNIMDGMVALNTAEIHPSC